MVKKIKGFTLIELLVVIAIIGILAALIIVALSGAQRRARDTQRKNNAKGISTALEQYAVDNSGNYPTSTAVDIATSCTTGGVLATALITGGYISSDSVCKDPQPTASTTFTRYAAGGIPVKYIIAWKLENKQENVKNNESTTGLSDGNGVYEPIGGTNFWIVGSPSAPLIAGLTDEDRFFITYGPQ